MHQAADQVEVVLSHIVRMGALPFRCDEDLIVQLLGAGSVPEATAAYRRLLERRLGVPLWLLVVMDIDLAVAAWMNALSCLVMPDGTPLEVSLDEDYERIGVGMLFSREDEGAPLNAEDLWAGPVTTGVRLPLQLFTVDSSAGEAWRLDMGSVGGNPNTYMLPSPEVVALGRPIQGVVDLALPMPLLTRVWADRVEQLGQQWELAWKDRAR
jgi:hypothetical protein